MRIKNFDFTLGVAYSIGGYILDKSYLSLMSHQGPGYNLHRDALNSWTVDNTASDNPVIAEGYRDGTQTSNRFLIDASWFSISTLSLGYTLNNDWIKSYGISSMRLYAMANNIYLWSAEKGLDPRFITEQETKYPAVRTFSLGVKLDF